VKSPARTYTVSAKYYDAAYAVKKDLVDLPFYVEVAKKYGGPVLEIGCGTGRVLLPIAREGIEIHGVDSSPAMLGVLKKRLKGESREVRREAKLSTGDMRTLRMKKKYPLVIMPFRPLQHMHALRDQIAALRAATLHLNKGGVFAFDVFFPKFEGITAAIGQEKLELEWSDPEDATKTVRRYYRMESVDKVNQTFSGTFRYATYQGDKLLSEETEPLRMSYYGYPQLRALFLLAGLEPAEEYGSFAKTPLDNTAEQMVFLLKKA
jgi:ubiquinone/menaquinone biosynthesis C-methylase UbiE